MVRFWSAIKKLPAKIKANRERKRRAKALKIRNREYQKLNEEKLKQGIRRIKAAEAKKGILKTLDKQQEVSRVKK